MPFVCSRVVDETQADDYSNLMSLFTASLPTFPTCKSSLKIDVNFLLQADSFVHSARNKPAVSRRLLTERWTVEWDWRSIRRSSSIDSNISVDALRVCCILDEMCLLIIFRFR